jgi:multidrug efflux pump subunit AcrB
VVRVQVDQDRARSLGISSQALSQTINAILSGTTVTQLRDDIYLIYIIARAIPDERAKLETLRSLMTNLAGGDRSRSNKSRSFLTKAQSLRSDSSRHTRTWRFSSPTW